MGVAIRSMPFGWRMASDGLFTSVPGAFTTICDTVHLPGFVDRVDELRECGFDDIMFVAVNDSTVMKAWSEAHGADGKITMVADGNGELTRALGLLADLSIKGLGMRGKRAAMVVEDMTVKWLVIDTLCEFKNTTVQQVIEDVFNLTAVEQVLDVHRDPQPHQSTN